MTDQEINIKIAEACGWTKCYILNEKGFGLRPGFVHEENSELVPNYCNDLNAMHKAENALTKGTGGPSRIQSYRGKLNGITNQPIHATARQRALAFISTLSL